MLYYYNIFNSFQGNKLIISQSEDEENMIFRSTLHNTDPKYQIYYSDLMINLNQFMRRTKDENLARISIKYIRFGRSGDSDHRFLVKSSYCTKMFKRCFNIELQQLIDSRLPEQTRESFEIIVNVSKIADKI